MPILDDGNKRSNVETICRFTDKNDCSGATYNRNYTIIDQTAPKKQHSF